MPLSRLFVSCASCLLLFCVPTAASDFEIIVVDDAYDYPSVPFIGIAVRMNGSIGSAEGATLDDEEISKLLKMTWTVDKKKICLLYVSVIVFIAMFDHYVI